MRNLITILISVFVFSLMSSFSYAEEKDIEIDYSAFPGLKAIVDNSEMGEKVIEALKDAGDNWESLAGAIVSVSGEKQDDLIWQITVMPHLDRLEATKEILLEHLTYAYIAKDEFEYKIPPDMFREYILVYRIGDEPVTQWRQMLFDRFRDIAGKTPADTAKNVNTWVAENVSVRERGFFGPRQAPDQVIKNGLGTKEDVATLTTAILKCLGVPSRSARCMYFGEQKGGETWVEIYDGSRWIPLYPDNPDYFGDFGRYEKEYPHNITVVATTSAFSAMQITDNYTDTGTIEFSFIRHGVPQKNFEHFGIAVYNDGGWLPLDDLGFDLEESRMATDDEAKHPVILGDGKYLVQAGTRIKDGSVYMFTKEVTIKPGDLIPMEINLDPPIDKLDKSDLIARELDSMPEWELPVFNGEGMIYSNMAYVSRYSVIAFFDISQEPSQRMIPTLVKLRDYTKSKITVVGIHAGPVEKEKLQKFIEENGISFPVSIDVDGKVADSFMIPRNQNDEAHFTRLPSIMLMFRGTVLLWQEGYELGISDYIVDMVEYNEGFFE